MVKARQKSRVQGAIGFTCHWLKIGAILFSQSLSVYGNRVISWYDNGNVSQKSQEKHAFVQLVQHAFSTFFIFYKTTKNF